jgi:hypothetical protein
MFNSALLGRLWRFGIERDAWWNPNLAINGADGALTFLQELSGWDYGRMLEKVERLFQATPNSKWEMGPGLAFGTICGSGI